MKTCIILLTLILASIQIGISQGTFQDLDFEEATILQSGGGVSAADAFPGWQTFIGSTALSTVHLDAASAGGPLLSLVNNDPSDGGFPIQGNYSVGLFGGGLPPNNFVSTSISQTGTVPIGTQSIQMDAVEFGGTFTVTVGGEIIKMSAWQVLPNYTVYAGNISAWSGQSTTLSITENANPAIVPDELLLDNIVFSPVAVTPEPNPLTLMSVGGLLFALFRRFQSTRK